MFSKNESDRRSYCVLRLMCFVASVCSVYLVLVDVNGSRFSDLHYRWAIAQEAAEQFYQGTGVAVVLRDEVLKRADPAEDFRFEARALFSETVARSVSLVEMRLIDGGRALHLTFFGKGIGPEVDTATRHWKFVFGEVRGTKPRAMFSTFCALGQIRNYPLKYWGRADVWWPHGDDKFWREWGELVAMWRSVPARSPSDIAKSLQYRLTTFGRVWVDFVGLLAFGVALWSWAHTRSQLRRYWREFLGLEIQPRAEALSRRYGVRVSVPSFRAFIWARDINRLQGKWLERLKGRQRLLEVGRVARLANSRLAKLCELCQSQEDRKRIDQVLRHGSLREKRCLAAELEDKLRAPVQHAPTFGMRAVLAGSQHASSKRGGGVKRARPSLLAGHSGTNGRGEVKRLTFRSFVHDKLELADLLASESIDAEMTKAVVCVLVSLTSSGRSLVAHHRRRRTTQGLVRNYYRCLLRKDFDENEYARSLRWLLQNGVLVVYDEHIQDQNFALNLRKATPRSIVGQAVMSRVLLIPSQLREMKNAR